MIIRIQKIPTSLVLNYENSVVALAVVYLVESLHLVSLYPAIGTALKVLQFILLGFIGFLFCRQRTTVNNLLVKIIVLAVFVLSFVFSGTFPFLKYGIVLLAGMNCNVSKLYTKLLKTYVICVTVTVLLGILQIIPSQIVRRGYSTYGFSHVNVFAQYVLSILCCYVILNGHKFKLKQWAILLCTIAVTQLMTDSKTTIISMIAMVLLIAFRKGFPKAFHRGGLTYYLAILMPIFCLIINLIMGLGYGESSSGLSAIDQAMNGRLGLANNLLNAFRLSMFGQDIAENGVESAYLMGLYQYGLIPMAVECIIYMYAIRKSMCSHSFGVLICLLAMALHGMAEVSAFNPFANVALLSTFSRNSAMPVMPIKESEA